MNIAWPLVVNRLVALLPTLPGWSDVTVYDGQPMDAAFPTDFITVGFVEDDDTAGSWEPTPLLGDLEEEVGSVRSELVCQSGDVDMPARRARAFELLNALKTAVDADPTFGLSSVAAVSLSADVLPVQNSAGSAVRLAVTLAYTARGV